MRLAPTGLWRMLALCTGLVIGPDLLRNETLGAEGEANLDKLLIHQWGFSSAGIATAWEEGDRVPSGRPMVSGSETRSSRTLLPTASEDVMESISGGGGIGKGTRQKKKDQDNGLIFSL